MIVNLWLLNRIYEMGHQHALVRDEVLHVLYAASEVSNAHFLLDLAVRNFLHDCLYYNMQYEGLNNDLGFLVSWIRTNHGRNRGGIFGGFQGNEDGSLIFFVIISTLRLAAN